MSFAAKPSIVLNPLIMRITWNSVREMTITNTYLEGSMEPFSETIRALTAREWNNTNTDSTTPKFLSGFGTGDDAANLNKPLKANDYVLKDDESAIIFREGNTVTVSHDNNFVELETTVYVDIYGTTKLQLLCKEEFDRIIFENQPNSSIRTKKSDNSNDSPIINVRQNVIDWTKIGEIKEINVIEQLSGQIECLWEKQKS